MKPFALVFRCDSTLRLQDAVILPGVKVKSLAVPLQPTLQQEVILARMEQIPASRALTDDERAQLYMSAGVV